MDNSVIVNQIDLGDGRSIGQLTINRPKALNALDFSVVKILIGQLNTWLEDDHIVAVLLDSMGERAFCAGGDVVSMHSAMRDAPRTVPEPVKQFFTLEYSLDYLIHTYSKPIIVWGNGIVMGGGLGLLAGASHRIVTESARIAMPEVTIGLYPDVGASHFLHKMPGKTGLFLGLTGASINGTDALYINLADHFISHHLKSEFIEKLSKASWDLAAENNFEVVTQCCQCFELECETNSPIGQVESHQVLIDQLVAEDNAMLTYENIQPLMQSEDPWLQKAAKGFLKGSPLTIRLVHEQLKRSQKLSLEACFQMELVLSCRSSEYGEFAEGVRALLIDKDNQPDWKFKTVGAVPDSLINCFFTSPWADNHPLAFMTE